MESRRLEQLGFLLCCFAAITCGLHAQVQAQTTPQHLKRSSPHSGAVDRNLLGMENRSESLLSRRTRRIDPLDGLRKYDEGYNITNRHYWSSTIFTGRSGYIIAATWLLAGIISAGLLISQIFFAKKSIRCSGTDYFVERYHIWSVILCTFLAVLAIIASAIAINGAVRFHSRAESVEEIIQKTALEATATIYNITEAIAAMQNTSKMYNNNSSQEFYHLNSTVETLNSEAVEIQTKAETNMRLVSKGIKILEVVTVVTVVLNLVAIFAMLGMPQRLHKLHILCIVFCWVLTLLLWMYFGLYFFLDKFAGDTCVALDEYRLDPRSSTLGSIIPCSEKFSGNMILHDVGAGIHDIIDQVNANIFMIKTEYPVKLDYVCNPFSGPPEYRYRPENCSSGTVTIGDIPQMLKRLTCSDLGGGADCAPGELASAIDYDKVQTYTSSIQNILDIFPGTERLVNCELVKGGFADIVSHQCAPLRWGARAAWAALAVLSTTMVLLVLASAAGAAGERTRRAGDHSVMHHTSSSSDASSKNGTAESHSKKLEVVVVAP